MRKYLLYLASGVVTLTLLGIIIVTVPPSYVIRVSSLSLSIIPLAFLLLCVGLSYLFNVLFLHTRRGILTSLVLTLLLWLIYQQKLSIISGGIVILAGIGIEVFFTKRRIFPRKPASHVE